MSTESVPAGLKVVLLGDAAAGKSSLLVRYTTGVFNQQIDSTIGAAFKSKVVTLDNVTYRLDIWDTAGQERYRSILPMYYRNAVAAILVIDITNPLSLQVADRWVLDIRQKTESDECYIIMAANKVDLPNRSLSTDDIAAYCERVGIDYLETSALTGQNVKELFETICKNRVARGAVEPMREENVIQCTVPTEKRKSKCC